MPKPRRSLNLEELEDLYRWAHMEKRSKAEEEAARLYLLSTFLVFMLAPGKEGTPSEAKRWLTKKDGGKNKLAQLLRLHRQAVEIQSGIGQMALDRLAQYKKEREG